MRKLPVSGGRQGARRRVPARPRPCPSGRTCEPCCQTAHGRVHALANLVQGSRALCARQAAGAGRPAARPSARCPHGPGRQSRSARRRARGGRACTRASARSASSARTRGLSSPRSSLRTATATSSIRLGPWNRLRTARFCRPGPRARRVSRHRVRCARMGGARTGAHQGLTAACDATPQARRRPPRHALSGSAAPRSARVLIRAVRASMPSSAHRPLSSVPGGAAAAPRARRPEPRARLDGQPLAELAAQLGDLRAALQQQLARVGRRDLADVEARVQGLADAVQHGERAHHKREGRLRAPRARAAAGRQRREALRPPSAGGRASGGRDTAEQAGERAKQARLPQLRGCLG